MAPEGTSVWIAEGQGSFRLDDLFRYDGRAALIRSLESDNAKPVTVDEEELVVTNEFRRSKTNVDKSVSGRENDVGSCAAGGRGHFFS
jgi:hypothetical protein